MILFDDGGSVKKLTLSKQIFIYTAPPCDFWDGMYLADELEQSVILSLMPEVPRERTVFKALLPGNGYGLEAFYFCKADNNGTTYIFSNCRVIVDGDIDWMIDRVIENFKFKEDKNNEAV